MASRPIDIPGRGPIAQGPMANFLNRWSILRVIVGDELRRGHTKCLLCGERYLPNELVGFNRFINPNVSFYHKKCLDPQPELIEAVSAIPPEPFLPYYPFRIPSLHELRCMNASVRRFVAAPSQESMGNFLNNWNIFRLIVWVEMQNGHISCSLCKKPYLPNEEVAFYSENPKQTSLKFYHRICLRPHYDCLGVSAIPAATMLPMVEFPKPLEQGSSRCAICTGEVLSMETCFWYNKRCKHACHRWCYPKHGRSCCPATGCFSPVADFILEDVMVAVREPIFEMDEDRLGARDAEIPAVLEEEEQEYH